MRGEHATQVYIAVTLLRVRFRGKHMTEFGRGSSFLGYGYNLCLPYGIRNKYLQIQKTLYPVLVYMHIQYYIYTILQNCNVAPSILIKYIIMCSGRFFMHFSVCLRFRIFSDAGGSLINFKCCKCE